MSPPEPVTTAPTVPPEAPVVTPVTTETAPTPDPQRVPLHEAYCEATRPTVPVGLQSGLPPATKIPLLDLAEQIRNGHCWVWANDVNRLLEALLPWSEVDRRLMKLAAGSPFPPLKLHAADELPDDFGKLPARESLLPPGSSDMLKRNREKAKASSITPSADKVLESLKKRGKLTPSATPGTRDPKGVSPVAATVPPLTASEAIAKAREHLNGKPKPDQ
jgi:hypothetical protein